jgi:hypothetical protein
MSSISTNAASSVGTTSATLNGSYSGSGGYLWFYWGTSSGSLPYSTGYYSGNGSGGSYYWGLTGLNPSTTYYYQAVGFSYGNGSVRSFTTGTSGPYPPSVATWNASSVTTTSAVVNGTIDPYVTNTTYNFTVSTDPTFNTNYWVTGTGPLPGNNTWNNVNSLLQGLIPNTTYYYHLNAYNSVGDVAGGNLSFTTSALLPTATTGSASANGTTATIYGTVSDNGLAADGGGNSTYNFNWATNPGLSPYTGTTPTAFSGNGNNENWGLTGLTASTTYYYQIVAWSGQGYTYGSIQSFTTNGLPNAPTLTSPANGAALNIVASGVTFAWTYNTGGAGGGQTKYSLQLDPTPYTTYYYWTGSAWTTTRTDVASSAGSVAISAAQWNASFGAGTFYWSVATTDAAGLGPYAFGGAGGGSWTVISEGPPNAPTLGTPASGTYLDLSGTPTFSWTYSPSNAVGGQLNWAMRRRVGGGAYVYWNAGSLAWQSTIVWNSGAGQSYTFPAASWTDGSTYSWSVANEDAGGGGVSPAFAADFSVVAQAAPTVTVSEPTGTQTTQTPIAVWSVTPATGAAQTAWQVRTFTAAQYGAGGFNPATSAAVDDSGVVSNANTSYQIAATLPPATTYRSYVNSTETGGESNAFNAYGGYTVALDLPSTPTLTATATQDTTSLPGDGAMSSFYLPMIQLVAQASLNMLSAVDSSFESGVGSFTGTLCTLTQSATKYLDGAYSLEMVANSTTGSMSAASTYYACQPNTSYTALGSFLPGTTSRGVTVGLHWFTSGDVSISTSMGSPVTEATSAVWTQASVTAASPANAAYFQVVVSVASVANAEVHYVDEVGVFPGTVSTWTVGGLLGSAGIVILRSDGVYVRHASTANPANIPATTQTVTVNDYEVVPGTPYNYQALVQATEGSSTVQSTYCAYVGASIQPGLGFWEFDPLNPAASAAPAQPTGWSPSQIIQSTAHPVLGQTTMNLVQYAVQQPDFSATFETFSNATYNALKALTLSQRTVFVSQPYGEGPYYFNLAPQPGGGGGGSGNTAHSTNLYPSAPGAPMRSVAVTAIGAPRPAV